MYQIKTNQFFFFLIGNYDNSYFESAFIKNSYTLSEKDDHDWEKVMRTPGLEDSPKVR
jgi:hypothetical protein